jgi:hypothetical protein
MLEVCLGENERAAPSRRENGAKSGPDENK